MLLRDGGGARSLEMEAADFGGLATPGDDPGIREVPVPRGAGGSAELGAADGRGQSGDEAVVMLDV